MKALFDTNILIDYLNGRDESRRELGRYRERLVSVVTWMEVLAGAHDAPEADVIEMFLRDFRVAELTRQGRELVCGSTSGLVHGSFSSGHGRGW